MRVRPDVCPEHPALRDFEEKKRRNGRETQERNFGNNDSRNRIGGKQRLRSWRV